jgi:GGDEF domain-containing protein
VGLLTRAGLEKRWNTIRRTKNLSIAYIDIDKLKEANALYGIQKCDRKLAKAYDALRQNELIGGKAFYGDEVIVCASRNEIIEAVRRFNTALQNEGMTATIAIIDYNHAEQLNDAIKNAVDIVERFKINGVRNQIFDVREKNF